MIKNLVETIGGIGIYGLISMLLFFAVFAGVLVWVFRLRRPYLERMKHLPLDETNPESEAGEPNHE